MEYLLAAGFQGCPLPSRMVAHANDEELIASFSAQRNADPHTYAATEPPPGAVRLPAEFEPKGELHLVFPGWLDHEELFLDIVQATWDQGEVHVHLMHGQDRLLVRELLRERGIPLDRLRVHSGWPVESIWIRDYGPMSIELEGGDALLDWAYALDCLDDDALPTRLGEATRRPVFRPALVLDGGNFSSDGEGTCFTTTSLADVNDVEPEAVRPILEAFVGCKELVVLEPLAGNVIDHLDQLLVIGEDGLLLIADPDPLLDPVNHRIMQRNRMRLEHLVRPDGSRYRVVGVPMPPPGAVASAELGQGPLLVSYLNLLLFNGVVVVPVYQESSREAEALLAIAQAFPSRRVVPVLADRVAQSYGTVHCLTVTLP
jgi:agmatine deiminase